MPSELAEQVRRDAKKTYGVVPNFFRAMDAHTGAPGAVYMAADKYLMEGVLTAREQQAVLLALAHHHSSRYDAVVHARMALDAGLSPVAVDRLLDGETPEDERLAALVEATRESVEKRGWLAPKTLRAWEQRGVSRGDLYEIFALIGMKTFTSFTHHIADTDIDEALQDTERDLNRVPEKPDTIERKRLVVG
jgi:alkylhydroperoxidase family enzyme